MAWLRAARIAAIGALTANGNIGADAAATCTANSADCLVDQCDSSVTTACLLGKCQDGQKIPFSNAATGYGTCQACGTNCNKCQGGNAATLTDTQCEVDECSTLYNTHTKECTADKACYCPLRGAATAATTDAAPTTAATCTATSATSIPATHFSCPTTTNGDECVTGAEQVTAGAGKQCKAKYCAVFEEDTDPTKAGWCKVCSSDRAAAPNAQGLCHEAVCNAGTGKDSNGDCVACDEANCADCAANKTVCNQCGANYDLSAAEADKAAGGTCSVNQATINCKESYAGTCKECVDGYALDAGKCVKCTQAGCKTCTAATANQCDVCMDGYHLDNTAKTCAQCTGQNCKTCTLDRAVCSECPIGFTNKTGTCFPNACHCPLGEAAGTIYAAAGTECSRTAEPWVLEAVHFSCEAGCDGIGIEEAVTAGGKTQCKAENCNTVQADNDQGMAGQCQAADQCSGDTVFSDKSGNICVPKACHCPLGTADSTRSDAGAGNCSTTPASWAVEAAHFSCTDAACTTGATKDGKKCKADNCQTPHDELDVNKAGKCKTCNAGYALKADGTCEACTASDCKSCATGALDQCTTCEDGWYVSGNDCKEKKCYCPSGEAATNMWSGSACATTPMHWLELHDHFSCQASSCAPGYVEKANTGDNAANKRCVAQNCQDDQYEVAKTNAGNCKTGQCLTNFTQKDGLCVATAVCHCPLGTPGSSTTAATADAPELCSAASGTWEPLEKHWSCSECTGNDVELVDVNGSVAKQCKATNCIADQFEAGDQWYKAGHCKKDQCKPGYVWQAGKCKACAANCDQCNTSGEGKCDVCSTKFIVKADKSGCDACAADCDTCTAAGKCEQSGCSTGFHSASDGASGFVCVADACHCPLGTASTVAEESTCNDGNWDATKFHCSACNAGITLADNKCKAADCTTHADDADVAAAGKCTACATSHPVAEDGVCRCAAKCGECEADPADQCKADKCIGGYYFDTADNASATYKKCKRGTCHCPLGTPADESFCYADATPLTPWARSAASFGCMADSCDQDTEAVTAGGKTQCKATNCTEHEADDGVNAGKCKVCADGYVLDSATGTCKACAVDCKKCDTAGAGKCDDDGCNSPKIANADNSACVAGACHCPLGEAGVNIFSSTETLCTVDATANTSWDRSATHFSCNKTKCHADALTAKLVEQIDKADHAQAQCKATNCEEHQPDTDAAAAGKCKTCKTGYVLFNSTGDNMKTWALSGDLAAFNTDATKAALNHLCLPCTSNCEKCAVHGPNKDGNAMKCEDGGCASDYELKDKNGERKCEKKQKVSDSAHRSSAIFAALLAIVGLVRAA